MTLVWIIHVLALSAALGSVAYLAERLGVLPHAGGRWIWIAAMIVSFVIPLAFVLRPLPPMPEHHAVGLAVPSTPSTVDSAARWVMVSGGHGGPGFVSDAVLGTIWFALSALLFLWWAATQMRLHQCVRSCITADVAGRRIFLSEGIGPAVVGALRARIVAPSWMVAMPQRQQDIVLMHEEEHIAAGDPQVWAGALALLFLVPWNVPLWFQVARLRRAIEVDCDARVMRRGIGAAEYGHVLLDIGSRSAANRPFGAAMGISLSFLEQRIRLMLQPRRHRSRWITICMAGLASACVAVASTLAPPLPNRTMGDVMRFAAGYYMSASQQYFIIRDGGDGPVIVTHGFVRRLVPNGRNPFKFKIIGAAATIELQQRSSAGQASAFTWSDDAGTARFARVDRAVITPIDGGLAKRVRANRPYPEGGAILLRQLSLAEQGMLARENFAVSTEKYLANRERTDQLAELGSVRTVRFVGVGSVGTDFYHAEFQRGVVQFEMHMDSAGRVSGLAWHKL